MPTIACLGWGSLIWCPKYLPIIGEWEKDGPVLPVEFLRQSSNGRITLVLDAGGTPVPSLWTRMKCPDLDSAVAALQKREDILTKTVGRDIGRWSGGASDPLIPTLADWAKERQLDCVIWTALTFSSKSMRERRSAEQVVEYLRNLTDQKKADAEEYVRLAPRQIDTAYRRKIENDLGWTCLAP